MSELFDVIDAFPLVIKATWVVWAAWGVGQFYWYREDVRRATVMGMPPAMPTWSRKALPAPPAETVFVASEAVPEMAMAEETDSPALRPEVVVAEVSVEEPADLDALVADFDKFREYHY